MLSMLYVVGNVSVSLIRCKLFSFILNLPLCLSYRRPLLWLYNICLPRLPLKGTNDGFNIEISVHINKQWVQSHVQDVPGISEVFLTVEYRQFSGNHSRGKYPVEKIWYQIISIIPSYNNNNNNNLSHHQCPFPLPFSVWKVPRFLYSFNSTTPRTRGTSVWVQDHPAMSRTSFELFKYVIEILFFFRLPMLVY